ncbi:hypothetical protein [Superficieibacter electus]|uniref:hypothetical protein n=1 Tax=Superficieibacter electus TaxID=2022662 RepID=UPI001FE9C291|nr:hypothetical protein [Superficieibacter electus]
MSIILPVNAIFDIAGVTVISIKYNEKIELPCHCWLSSPTLEFRINTYLEKELFIKRIKQNEDRAFVLRDRLYYSINEIMRKDCLLVMDNKTSEN